MLAIGREMLENDSQIVIGKGEIGQSLSSYLIDKEYSLLSLDIKDENYEEKVKTLKATKQIHNKIIHICFGYDKDFEKTVKFYIDIAKPRLVIIHSTVPVGTTRKFGRVAVHSPVIGIHPQMIESLKTFPKMMGGISVQKVLEASQIFDEVAIYDTPEETESAKLLSTTYYAWNILYEKYVHQFCKENNLSFDNVYTETNRNYNVGYRKLGKDNVVRPVLKHVEGKIGGHCVIPNAEILKKTFEPARLILKQNETYGKKKSSTSKARNGMCRTKKSNLSKSTVQSK